MHAVVIAAFRSFETTTEDLAYFYCDHRDTATQKSTNIGRSLVKHVANSKPAKLQRSPGSPMANANYTSHDETDVKEAFAEFRFIHHHSEYD